MPLNKGTFDPYNIIKSNLNRSAEQCIPDINTALYAAYIEHIREKAAGENKDEFYTKVLKVHGLEDEPLVVNIIETVLELKRLNRGHQMIELPMVKLTASVDFLIERMDLYNFLS